MKKLDKSQLFNNLQTAIELEHSTIPPYLTAYFTIDQKHNAFSWNVIRSVFMEEMLHMTLACNVLNAVGGSPYIDNPNFIPEYPTEFNFGGRKFDVGLIKFSKPAIETFLEIEKPDEVKLKVEGEHLDHLMKPIDISKQTIGEFYEVVKNQLIYLVENFGEEAVFSGDINRQLGREEYYGGGGEIIKVHNLETALLAIDVIVDQGEGSVDSIYDHDHTYFGQEKEVAHFFRFNEILKEQKYKEGDSPNKPPSGEKVVVHWHETKNMVDNPKAKDFPLGSAARTKADEFNQLYSQFLDVLHDTFNGKPSLMKGAVGMMYQMKYIAQDLLNCPISESSDLVAGPPFEYIHNEERESYHWSLKEFKKKTEMTETSV